MNMELISKEAVLELIEHSNVYSVNLMQNIVSNMPTVKAIPIERLEQIRAEIAAEVLSHSGTGEEVIQAYVDGLNHSLRLIDKANKEQN